VCFYNLHQSPHKNPRDQVELSGGWGGYYGFVGTLGLVFNNFSARNIFNFSKYHPVPKGDGQRVALRFQASGKQYQTYSATFTEPWLGGKKPNSFSISLSQTVINNYVDYSSGFARITNDRSGGAEITGITLSLGRRLQKPDDFFSLSNSISYQKYTLLNYPLFSSDFSTGNSNSFVFNTTLSRSSIDNNQFPRGGSSFSLSLSLTPPYSFFQTKEEINTEQKADKYKFIEYHKWMFDATWYTSLIGKLVLSTRVHMGFLGNYNKPYFSPFERFVMGGSGMSGQNMGNVARDIIGLRGYQDNSIGPQSANGPVGGIVYDKFVMEARYPVSLNPSATIFVLGFAEAGNNWDNYQEYNPLDVKRSAGFGARIFMPAFGLIGIDYGWGFDRPGGVAGQFHFTIGQQFR
jgi:outer membrane protein insertion porin family